MRVNARLQAAVDVIGLPRLFIIAFLTLLFVTAWLNKLPLPTLLSNSLVRFGMNGILVLAMVPTIQAGVGLNFGLPVGIICGVVGVLMAMEHNIRGVPGLCLAIAVAMPLAAAAGVAYGNLLNRVKGQEMMVGTYVGFSVVAGMCMFWLAAPFRNAELIWVLGGQGLRVTLTLNKHFAHVLDKLWLIKAGSFQVSLGLLGMFFLCCGLMWLFMRTKLGMAVRAAGSNPAYAASSGIDVDRMRIVAVTMSTMLGALGIIIYAQSFGFLQLYMAPLMMAFPAVAAILIGGASTRKATIFHVIVGTLLFQTLLSIALPVTRSVIEGDISEVARIIIANGMILYALTRGGDGR